MSRCYLLVALLAVGCIGGCFAPGATFTRVACDRIGSGGQLDAMAFTAEVETQGLAGTQLLYRVRVLDRNGKPIKSINHRYEDQSSNVAASKSLMVLESPWEFSGVRIAIPAAELEVKPDDMPAYAEFGLYVPEGECLARKIERLPLAMPQDFPEYSALAQAGGQAPPDASSESPAPDADYPQGAGETEYADNTSPYEDSSDASDMYDESVADSGEQSYEPIERTWQEPDQPGEQSQREPERDTTVSRSPWENAADKETSELTRYEETTPPPPPAQTTVRTGEQPNYEADSAERTMRAHVYRIQPGDTLESIAIAHYGDAAMWKEILKANPDLDARHLRADWPIVLPARVSSQPPAQQPREERAGLNPPVEPQPKTEEASPGPRQIPPTYTVQSGDTLTGIAKRVLGDKNRWRDILRLNRDQLTATNWLRVGMVLRMPVDEPDKHDGAGSRGGSGSASGR